ncbi:hypothetical protein SIO70_00410 [Chitinophaga sancti]|uniref:hypothetical protein n=1 Tax=Chitinophaga sancti TaxID=1004 RepID=UPI002A7513AA|nr:hypothetical protein [Chitinophaga sancti]WPQ63325.1 hypothetical protein SIO70_00410 [Chitinophaga sancti]
MKTKLTWIGLGILPVLLFIGYTTYTFKIKTNNLTFSPFGGWQIGSNALYMYSHVSPKVKEKVPPGFRNLHAIVTHHIDSLSHVKIQNRPDNNLGFYYLWGDGAPLKKQLIKRWEKDSTTPYLKRWVSMSPLYGAYGSWLIRQYPVEYARYYIWPNLISYYAPPPEFLGMYNMGKDSVDAGALIWFKYKTSKVHGPTKDKKIVVTAAFPIILALLNVLFITGFIGFAFIGGFKKMTGFQKKVLYVLLLVWFANLGFSVLASPIVLRYQVFPFIFTLTFACILMGYVIRESFVPSPKEEKPDISPRIASAL